MSLLEKEIKEVLKEINEKGFEIRDILKEQHKSSFRRPVEELLVDPDLFYYSLFESFWKLFRIINENIENPLVQPWIRVIVELSSDIFWYSKKSEIEKKEIACEYWLCAIGLVGGKQGSLNYETFLSILEDTNEKNKFLTLKNEGYPPDKIHKTWHKLFPTVNETLPSFMEEYFVNLNGNYIKRSQLNQLFRDMSLYHHPNIIMGDLEREFKDKSHIFRCFALISVCAMSLIKFSAKGIIKKPEINFSEEFDKKINELIKGSYQDLRAVKNKNQKN